ncbi:MAG: methionine--tRNA ligase [candidate division Zixibacteria bacterium]|nr:methionine--tRNA ligase [candidate division Zixibacteria bacterium]
MKPIYITTPIYYINDVPHIGHAYTTIAADFLARFHKLAGRETHFVTGTDEHGTKIAEVAQKRGMSEIEFCDSVVREYEKAWENLTIDNDYFIRTTSKRHEKAVRRILDAMKKAKTDDGQDVVYSGYYEGLYCIGCEKFLTEKDLVDGQCPDHKREPEKLREKNYFFRFSAFKDRIKEKILSGELLILPEERRREVLGLIEQDLPDFSLSREHVTWGIPLTFDKSQVAYVWVDALTNYITAIGYADDEEMFAKWWQKAEVVHLMAKEILKFHCLYWPAMLMAAGLKTPDKIFLHGFFTVDGEKMSKTLGNQINPNDMVAEFGADVTRYLLLTQYPFGVDGDIQAKRFVMQYNSDLANDLGNLVSRVVTMIMRNFDGQLPEFSDAIENVEPLLQQARDLPQTAYGHIKEFRLTNAIGEALNLVRATNKFFNDAAPWQMAKEGDLKKLGGVLYACAEIIRIVSIVLYPIMPSKMKELRTVFSLDDSTLTLEHAGNSSGLKPGTGVKLDEPLFPRLNSKKSGDATTKTEKKKAEPDNLLDISEFARAKLVVAEVIAAENVEGADKLLKLQIDIGTEKRQIVAGVAQYYSPEKITGMKIIVVTNLKPAVIRGIESNGMLLAAKAGKQLFLVTPDGDLPPGAKIS